MLSTVLDGVFPWGIVQCAGLYGGLDGTSRTKCNRQDCRDYFSNFSFCGCWLRAQYCEYVFHPFGNADQDVWRNGHCAESVTLLGFIGNLIPVILGNLVGGSVLVGFVYHIIYQRGQIPPKPEDK